MVRYAGLDIGLPPARSRARIRMALLLGATALTGVLTPYCNVALAQNIVIHDGATGDDGADFIGQADADDGHAPSGPVVFTNTAPQNTAGNSVVGSARGGRGGAGGTAFNFVIGFPPVEIQGGDGGNGAAGGMVDITNTATLTANGGHGVLADSGGGNGGHAGWGAALGYLDGGDGGNGGNGGSAKATTTAASVITTTGVGANGITVLASGGDGGNGGTGGAIGVGVGGAGGRGGNGGTAIAINAGNIDTHNDLAKGILVRSAGGSGGDGKDGEGIFGGTGGNGGLPTIGGTAEGSNSGNIVTHGNYASGMVIQSVGGGGGDGGGAFGFFGGGGAGADGNNGGNATGTNTGTITTHGVGAIGMLVESVGGGGGDGGGAVGIVSIGGSGAGGGNGGLATAHLGGSIVTGANGGGDGAHGVLVQSVGGGGGNGGYALAAGNIAAVAIGGSGGTGGDGNLVTVDQAGSEVRVSTSGRSAIGILAQSVGGGGGNGGGAFAVGGATSIASVAVGGSGGAAGNSNAVNYNIANANVTTRGTDSISILAQSVGGGGGNGGFALSGALVAGVGVGGSGSVGGSAGKVDMRTGGTVNTYQDRSAGIVAQSIGGGGGNGGFSAAGGLGASVGVGGKGGGGGNGGEVVFSANQQSVTTRGAGSFGVIVQSIGGGGGNGGFAGAVAAGAAVGVGGSGGTASHGSAVAATYNGSVQTFGVRSIGILVQSVGGGGGNGGGVLSGAGLASVGVGGGGGGGGDAGKVAFSSQAVSVETRQADSAGIIVQSIGGGGGNGGFTVNALSIGSVGVGGQGEVGGDAKVFHDANGNGTFEPEEEVTAVSVNVSAGQVVTGGARSSGIIAQAIGGGGGTGGIVVSAGVTNIGVGGKGSGGGDGGIVELVNGAAVTTRGIQSHGLLAQSLGGGGGSGGFALAVGGPSLAIGGAGNAGGSSAKVTVRNTGELSTSNDLSVGLLAQSIGGSGGDGGFADAGSLFAAVGVGGKGAAGGFGGEVEVVNIAKITTRGSLAHGILAQSVGGGGGNGGSAAVVSAGVFAGIGVSVGGVGGAGRDGKAVSFTHSGDITVGGTGAKGILAQSIGGGGGNGGQAFSGAFSAGLYGSAAVAVSVGGGGGEGGAAGEVTLKADGNIRAGSEAESGGIVAQSIGGGGGNGGRATTDVGAISDGVAVNLGVGVGGGGGGGGYANTVRVETGLNGVGRIETHGFQSVGILAQSIGGGGGSAGDTLGGAEGYGNNATVSAQVNIGGGGGDGDHAGAVDVTNAMTIVTSGDSSSAIVAQSIGGGGGMGGSSTGKVEKPGAASGVNVGATFAMGGGGGVGSYGNVVEVSNSGVLQTSGDFSSGIIAQSIGGGGGIGGSSLAKSQGSASQTNVNVNLALAGAGGGASEGRKVTVNNSGFISTAGFGSSGIVAMSVGGGGGAAGAASASDEDDAEEGESSGTTKVSIGVALALGQTGGAAGNGGEVEVTNGGLIFTDGAFSHGISASSIGGGGGIGGAASAGAAAEYAIGGGIGGKGGSSGNGLAVEVTNLAGGWIWTRQENSIGIFAQSVGGGGGSGGAGKSTGSNGGTVDIKMSMGGVAAGGGDGGIVTVTNAGFIETEKANSHGIMAQSLGGSGGVGGAAGSATSDANVTVSFSLGGAGGDGGIGEAVTVKNLSTGAIWTRGDNSYGIFAQSIGGGGGAAGSGSTASGASKTASVNLAIGGMGGEGNRGGSVRVDNFGTIATEGALSHGIFAQSVGGGGGAAGSASNTSSASMSVGVATSIAGGGGANGGYVEVNNDGLIETRGHGAIGIMAQSVGGGGGYTGVVSNDASGDSAFGLSVGGKGGNGGDGGVVKVTVSGDIVTHGQRAHGVVAQSIGGGGGYGGDAKGKTSNALAIGGIGGAGGDGKDVTVIRTGTITTLEKDSIAIIAQSIGGGGGFGGAGFGRFGASEDGGSGLDNNTIGFQSPGGDRGTSGIVTITQTGEINTVGDRSHGIVAQAVGGGGGAGGTNSLAMGQSGAGSQGGIGDAKDAVATANSQVNVAGASAYALFGQSATGQGISGAVTLTAHSNLFAQGLSSVAAYGESTSNIGFAKGNITINLNGAYTVGGGGDIGVAAMLVGGADNVLNNRSLLYAMGHDFDFSYVGALPAGPVPVNAILESLLDDFSPMAIMGTSGNDRIVNIRTATTLGRVIGNIDLGIGLNSFHNGVNSSMVGLAAIDLGGGLFANDGLMSNKGIGVVASVAVTGGYTQTSEGAYVTDLDLDIQTNDYLGLSEAGDFDGDAPLNFLSIDRLFGEYLLSRGDAMTDSGLTPTTLHPAVGFDFRTRVDDGTDLVLYADKPSFESLIKDPASGVTDTGAVQMAQYLDGLEGVMSPADAPSQLARMTNMIRFLPNEVEFGKAMMRLTPHYAVHTFEMANRVTDMVLESTLECFDQHRPIAPDGSCIWFSITPDSNYKRDAGFGTAERQDQFDTLSFGGLGEYSRNWSLGAAVARSEFDSDISFNKEELSSLHGTAWQAYALAKYEKDAFFADIAVGGGTGNTEGKRDTTLAQVGYIPGETLEGVYLPELLLEGIGNSVSFSQDIAQFGASVRFGYSYYPIGNAYVQPTLQFDARHIRVSGEERGSAAAFTFDGTSNAYFSVTPGLELGADVAISDRASLRFYARGGIEFSNLDWKIEGQLKAAEGLGAALLRLTEEADSPLYRVGGGIEVNGINGVGLSVRYDGAFGENVEHQSVSGTFKVRF
ncbi:autotransporter outer membrane beta-barrel domain-containing protein [Mesorhizobium sp. ANAO-SY3R2]|uniref:autotransporter outer membrane beta-barrel domain-containing protein n=1 Tax=Mesorhizobium sp. ANAO-SY3R2 TaxID=3166644 RepID=UPI00366E642F